MPKHCHWWVSAVYTYQNFVLDDTLLCDFQMSTVMLACSEEAVAGIVYLDQVLSWPFRRCLCGLFFLFVCLWCWEAYVLCCPGGFYFELCFLAHMKNESLCHDQCSSAWPAGRLTVCGKDFYIVIFSDTINMINVKLCVVVVLIELHPFVPLSWYPSHNYFSLTVCILALNKGISFQVRVRIQLKEDAKVKSCMFT